MELSVKNHEGLGFRHTRRSHGKNDVTFSIDLFAAGPSLTVVCPGGEYLQGPEPVTFRTRMAAPA